MAKVMDRIREDETYRKYRRVIRTIADDVDMDKLLDEAQGLFRTRKSRALYGKRPGATDLYEVQQQEMMVRTRLAEMSAQIHLKIGMVERANKTIKNHLIAEYGVALKEYSATAADRTAIIQSKLRGGISLLDRLETGVKVLDMLIKDLDQSGYGLRNSIDILKLLLGRPGQTEL